MENSNYYKNLRPDMSYYLPSRYEKVLEIGCGIGRFRECLAQECEYTGIAPVPKSVKFDFLPKPSGQNLDGCVSAPKGRQVMHCYTSCPALTGSPSHYVITCMLAI